MRAGAVLGGGLAAVGVTAVLSPGLLYLAALATLLAALASWARVATLPWEFVLTLVPWSLAALAAALAGGYVAGAIAGRGRARHGAAAAMLGLVVTVALGLGYLNVTLLGNVVALASLLAIPLVFLAGRLGASLAPRSVAIAPTMRPLSAERGRPVMRPAYGSLAMAGRKGGEREDAEQQR